MNIATGLAVYASHEKDSKGRRFKEDPPAHRSEYQRDRDRIVHSTAFRRLEYKTQVFVNHEGDLFRTRLTHSIEVAQIGRAIARALRLNEDLTEAVALAHDLGHTPFGHAGQDALNACMKDFGGFEHNFQSLRVVDQLEEKYADFQGLNLTFESREGILKHCNPTRAAELGELGQRFLDNSQPSLEAQLANLADEIAYNNHDVDDGLRAGLISIGQLREVQLFNEQFEVVQQLYPGIDERRAVHEIVRRMINVLVSDLINHSAQLLEKHDPNSSQAARQQKQPLISFSPHIAELNHQLKQFLRRNLYAHYKVYRMTHKAGGVISSLFELFLQDIKLLPASYYERAKNSQREQGDTGRTRVIADYIAGMTDRYAIAEYNRLFEPTQMTLV